MQSKENSQPILNRSPKEYVDAFMNAYFFETKNIVEHEKTFFTKNKLLETKVDYFKLKRFIITAIRRFQELDQKFLSGLLLKVYKDVETLFEYVYNFKIKTKLFQIIFTNEFLPSIPEYTILKENLVLAEHNRSKYESQCVDIDEKLKKLKSSIHDPKIKEAYKQLKLSLGDAAHHFATARTEQEKIYKALESIKASTHNHFLTTFKTLREHYISELMKYSNVKAFYLDKLLWIRASQSNAIKFFLATAQIKGDYDTKTFIKYYLKNINAENSADKEWHMYLTQVLKIL